MERELNPTTIYPLSPIWSGKGWNAKVSKCITFDQDGRQCWLLHLPWLWVWEERSCVKWWSQQRSSGCKVHFPWSNAPTGVLLLSAPAVSLCKVQYGPMGYIREGTTQISECHVIIIHMHNLWSTVHTGDAPHRLGTDQYTYTIHSTSNPYTHV